MSNVGPTFYSVTTTYPYVQDTVEAIVLGHITSLSLERAASLLFALVDGTPDPDFPGHTFHMSVGAIQDSFVRGYLWDESGIAFRPHYGSDGRIASVRVFPLSAPVATNERCEHARLVFNLGETVCQTCGHVFPADWEAGA